jgi:FAD/FMN-containing dehydrogenase
MIANNSSGSESIVHGTTIDHVEALEVVLADGSQATFARGRTHPFDEPVKAVLREHARAIAEDYPKHWRQSGGYRLDRMDPFDLSKLVVGSEGTLAIVTAATVRLVELPKAKMFAVGHFASVAEAIAATPDALELEPWPSRGPSSSTGGSRTGWKATRARCCSSPSQATATTRCGPSSTRSRPPGRRTGTATARCALSRQPSRPS